MKNLDSQKSILIVLVIGVVLMALYFVFVGGKEKLGGGDSGYPTFENASTGADRAEPVSVAGGKYQDFSEEAFTKAGAEGKRRIYFFSATWCSTCKVAHQDFLKNSDKLPEGVAIFKIDYDSNGALRKEFEIPYQHTFVEVDANGNKIQAWSGGAVAEVIQFTK